MSEIHTLKELKTLVDKQGQTLLNAIARLSAGEYDSPIEIPEGVDVLTNLAHGLTFLAEDMALLVKRHKKLAARFDALQKELNANKDVQDERPAETNGQTNGPTYLPSTGQLTPLTNTNGAELHPARSEFKPTTNGSHQYDQQLIVRNQGQIFDMLELDRPELERLGTEEYAAIEAVIEQLGLALENQSLFDQTQQALQETETLYKVSALLNSAEAPDDILTAISSTIPDIDGINLWIAVQETNRAPQWIELNLSYVADKNRQLNAIPTGSRFELSNYSFLNTLLFESRETALIEDLDQDVRTSYDTNLLDIFRQFNYDSHAFLPLHLGNRLIGLLTFGWNKKQRFTTREQNLFQAIAAQVATTIDSLRLLQETQLRAEQFALIAQIENQLSTITNEHEIGLAIAQAFPDASITIYYAVNEQASKAPTKYEVVTRIKKGVVSEEFKQLRGSSNLVDISPFKVLQELDNPNSFLHIDNIQTNSRIDRHTKERFEQLGENSFTILPLNYANAWIGGLRISWENAHTLSNMETYVLEHVREPLSAIIANRRSQLAEKEAREQSERLYQSSQRMNQAANKLNDILGVAATFVNTHPVNRAYIFFPETDGLESFDELKVTDIWMPAEASVAPGMPIGARIGMETVKLLTAIEKPTVLHSHANESQKSSDDEANFEIEKNPTALQRLLNRLNSPTVVVLPLILGNAPLGFLMLCTDETEPIPAENLEFLDAISPQIAVAVQNSRLLAGAQARAKREVLLREITEKVRDGNDMDTVMKTAVSEIGRVLGRKAFLYLKGGRSDEESM